VAIALAHLAAGVRVIAFEPDPAMLGRLRQNLELNPSLADRVRVLPYVVGAADGEERDPVTRSVDALIAKADIPPPNFVKIDVEGAEVDVIRGMRATLAEHRPTLLVETHGAQLEKDCAAVLTMAGYQVRIVRNAAWRKLYPEWRPIGDNRWLVAEPAVQSGRAVRK